MNITEVNERIAELEQALKQAIANFNALEGARQECEIWKNKLEQKLKKGE